MIKLYKSYCYLCSAACREFFCPRCARQMAWVRCTSQTASSPHYCQRCGAEEFQANIDYCDSCRDAIAHLQEQRQFKVTHNYPLAYYQGLFAELLQWYKFAKELPLAKYFTSLLCRAYRAQFSGYIIVPVPPREAKIKNDAWDQVAYLCRSSLPTIKLLQRDTTTQQKNLGREQRLEQLYSSDTYRLALPAHRLVWKNYRKQGPLHLLLFDDVYTTGATMDMCRRALYPLEQDGWIAEVRSLSLCLVP